MGPAIGPLIGGILNHFLGWRSIFWFVTIYGGVMLLVYLLLIPETCRNIVGNGSLPAQRWNRPLIEYLGLRKAISTGADNPSSERTNKQRPGILSTIPILLQKESFMILFFGGLVYAGYYIIITGLPQQLASTYNYNSIQVGLCYISIGMGPLIVRPIIGRIMDANFRRHARALGIEVVENRQQDIDKFPLSGLVCSCLSCLFISRARRSSPTAGSWACSTHRWRPLLSSSSSWAFVSRQHFSL